MLCFCEWEGQVSSSLVTGITHKIGESAEKDFNSCWFQVTLFKENQGLVVAKFCARSLRFLSPNSKWGLSLSVRGFVEALNFLDSPNKQKVILNYANDIKIMEIWNLMADIKRKFFLHYFKGLTMEMLNLC